MIEVRAATADDIEDIATIYAHHVTHGSASFETVPPGVQEIRARFESITGAGYPYLVAVDQEQHTVGYAYASAYRARHAYRFSVEDSIYIRDGFAGRGVGKVLLNRVVEQCTARGFRLMIAVIGDSQNAASISLHARCGFRMAGLLPGVGYKHGRWVDSVLMSRSLGAGERDAPGEITMPVAAGAH